MSKKKHKKKRARSSTDFLGGKKIYKSKKYTETYYTDRDEDFDIDIEETEEGTTTETPSKEELLEELNIINLSLDLVNIIVIATILNLYYVNSLKAETLDELYDSNLKDNFIDTSNFPKITNTLFLFTTGLFLVLNYTLLQESKNQGASNEQITSDWKSFLATLFAFLAITISRDNLEF